MGFNRREGGTSQALFVEIVEGGTCEGECQRGGLQSARRGHIAGTHAMGPGGFDSPRGLDSHMIEMDASGMATGERHESRGFALFFQNYSTFLAQPGIYLEDLFVLPAARGHGYGRQLLVYLARIAAERGCGRVEWSVLDWNEPAIGFYKKLGAVPMEDWTVFRLTGRALQALAAV